VDIFRAVPKRGDPPPDARRSFVADGGRTTHARDRSHMSARHDLARTMPRGSHVVPGAEQGEHP
jgi:hypothetical protein